MRFHAFLFDLDGTLIDEFDAIHRRYAHTLGRLGLPAPTREQVRGAVGGGLEKGLGRFVPADALPEALRLYREYWSQTVLDGVFLMPGGRELLEFLHGRGDAVAILSNKPGGASREICRHLGIDGFVPVIVGAEDTPWLKPRPELTACVLGRLGAAAAEAVMVGDSPYDIQTGHNAGVSAWCVSTGTHTDEELRSAGAERVFADLAQVLAAIRAEPRFG